jgi:D-alanyl-D-alanine carboxypeptidase
MLLAAEVGTAAARLAGPSLVEQLRRDTEAIHALGISGVQARVIAHDGRHSVATSGTADLRTGRAVPADGYFRMASTSKTLVATVVLQLEAEGRLSLDHKVDHWLPGVVQGTRWRGTSPTLPRPHARAYQFFGPGSRVDVTDQTAVDKQTVPVSEEVQQL